MAFIRLYSGSDGESHFEDMEMPPKGERLITKPTAGNITFFSYPGGSSADFHNTNARNYIIFLSGGHVEVEVGDGMARSFGPGDVCQMENLTGRGHKDRAVGDCLFAIAPMGDE